MEHCFDDPNSEEPVSLFGEVTNEYSIFKVFADNNRWRSYFFSHIFI